MYHPTDLERDLEVDIYSLATEDEKGDWLALLEDLCNLHTHTFRVEPGVTPLKWLDRPTGVFGADAFRLEPPSLHVQRQIAEDTCTEHGVFCCPLCFDTE